MPRDPRKWGVVVLSGRHPLKTGDIRGLVGWGGLGRQVGWAALDSLDDPPDGVPTGVPTRPDPAYARKHRCHNALESL